MSDGLAAVSLSGDLPASALGGLQTETARIRAVLGDWPEPAAPVRLYIGMAPQAAADDWQLAVAARSVHLRHRGQTYRFADCSALDDGGDAWLAALSAFAACGFAAPDALALALAWRAGDETRAADPWPSDLGRFPRVAGAPTPPAEPFAPCPDQLGIYPVLPDADWVERALDAGARTVQLRVKDAEPGRLRAEIERAVAAGRRYPDARIFINDHWQLAIEAGAYGVHLGQEDLADADLARLARAGLRLGLSSHGYFEILLALQMRPSYLALGPIFATATKQVAAPPQGIARLTRYAHLAGPHAPLVAIGGIDLTNIAEVRAAGVGSAAVVSAVTAGNTVAESLAALRQKFSDNRHSLK